LKRNIISYNKFIKLQPFIIVFVDVSATATAIVRTTIYDYLQSAAATRGGRSFGRRQQRLPKRQQKQ